ncbi:unnamed protein product [Lampetra planeri]
MARAAFPQMDDEAIDAVVLQKLLELARELRIIIQAVDNDDMCSLRAAKSMHAHLLLQRDSSIAVCASTSEPACMTDDDWAFATTWPSRWGASERPQR